MNKKTLEKIYVDLKKELKDKNISLTHTIWFYSLLLQHTLEEYVVSSESIDSAHLIEVLTATSYSIHNALVGILLYGEREEKKDE